MNKKASLNLSIQMIVIVVIAFVVLGLGLNFVRSQFGTIQETTSAVQEQIKQQILDDLRTGNKKLSFPVQTLNIEKGQSKDIAIGVKNTLPAGELNYRVDLKIKEMQPVLFADPLEVEAQVGFFYDKGKVVLPITESRVHSIKVSADGAKATYLVRLTIVDENDGSDYDLKTFFVTVY